VTLAAKRAKDGGGRAALELSVADTGMGIQTRDLPLLFQPFRQIDTGLQRQHEGTGLGLAICRRLTELLGGTVRVESTFGSGSVFTVMLPLEPEVGA
jgi:signal transduction histidine kinase